MVMWTFSTGAFFIIGGLYLAFGQDERHRLHLVGGIFINGICDRRIYLFGVFGLGTIWRYRLGGIINVARASYGVLDLD